MINLGIVMPIGKTVMYIPDGNDGPSGPWTETDTKVVISILVVLLILFVLAVIIELIRGTKLKNILLLDDWDMTMFSEMSIICFYGIWGFSLLCYLGYLIFGLL